MVHGHHDRLLGKRDRDELAPELIIRHF